MAKSITEATNYIQHIVFANNWNIQGKYVKFIPIIIIFVAIEWFSRDKMHPLQISEKPNSIKYFIYYTI